LPACLIHGLFGWGETTPLWGAAPCYFPIDELRKARPRGVVVAVQLGSVTSNHDRACECFAQLMGTVTDYGEAHAARCGHLRYGVDHRGEALLKQWDARHPIHLVGHSFGGNTALILVRLLAEDFWGVGTSATWVASVSTVCSPLRGCTLPFTWGLPGLGSSDAGRLAAGCEACTGRDAPMPTLFSVAHTINVACTPLLKAQLMWPWLKGLYDFRADQWKEQNRWWPILPMNHPYWRAGDNVINDATPTASAAALRATRRHLAHIYLVSVTCDVSGGVKPMPPPPPHAKLATAAAAAALALLMLRDRERLLRLLRTVPLT
jgi:pimeloyl-ACP methyl ester carboxylesterase